MDLGHFRQGYLITRFLDLDGAVGLGLAANAGALLCTLMSLRAMCGPFGC
jgi:hypothetical protein